MANFDPFEKEFRSRANALRRDPSAKTWDRLERRLDRRDRSGGMHILGIRPWMIAALVLLVAGAFGLSNLSPPQSGPLAQRAQSVEDLDAAFSPAENFDADAFRDQIEQNQAATTDDSGAPAGFRDVVVAEKYRS